MPGIVVEMAKWLYKLIATKVGFTSLCLSPLTNNPIPYTSSCWRLAHPHIAHEANTESAFLIGVMLSDPGQDPRHFELLFGAKSDCAAYDSAWDTVSNRYSQMCYTHIYNIHIHEHR